jgi:carboxymethylenebutenolidase
MSLKTKSDLAMSENQLNSRANNESLNDAAQDGDRGLVSEIMSLNSGPVIKRRGFMLGSLGAGFAASVVPTGALLAQTITTDTKGLDAGEIKIKTADGEVPGYYAKPAGKSNCATVLVVQEIFGVHEHIRDVCRRFAKAGFLAVAPEMFARQGDVSKMTNIAEIISSVVAKVPDAQVMSDLDATVQWATGNGGNADKLAITGFCWGGRITWMYSAHNPKVKAGVAWYGRLTGPQNAMNPSHPQLIAHQLNGPVLGLYGGADSGIPQDTIEEMKTRLALGDKASQASEFVVYPDTPHAFHADYRPSYRKGPAEDGWVRCLAWFKKYGLA